MSMRGAEQVLPRQSSIYCAVGWIVSLLRMSCRMMMQGLGLDPPTNLARCNQNIGRQVDQQQKQSAATSKQGGDGKGRDGCCPGTLEEPPRQYPGQLSGWHTLVGWGKEVTCQVHASLT